jgi:hypothetical protein
MPLPAPELAETTSQGIGGIANAPPGVVTITATIVATNRQLGSVAAGIQAGDLTVVWLRARAHY